LAVNIASHWFSQPESMTFVQVKLATHVFVPCHQGFFC
jgi:hypothetical protein